MDSADKAGRKRRLPLEDVIAPLVFMMVIAGAVVAWHRLVGVPLWLALVLGVLTGFLVVLGGVAVLSRVK